MLVALEIRCLIKRAVCFIVKYFSSSHFRGSYVTGTAGQARLLLPGTASVTTIFSLSRVKKWKLANSNPTLPFVPQAGEAATLEANFL